MYAWVPGHELDRPPEALPEPPPWLLRALNGSDTGKSSSPPQQPADANYGSGAEPIASGKRNATLTSLGGTLRKRGLSQLAIEAALRATNAERCNPPLDDNEIKTIAWSVSRYEPDQIATLAAEGADVEPLKPITLGELIATYPTLNEPIVDGILRRGEVANIIAKSKVGKSWLSYGLGLSVATGGRWFGRFGCTQGRVLLLDNELQRPTLSSRIPRVAQSMGIDPADVADSFHVLPLRGRLKSIDELLPFFREIPEGMYALVVIDALYRMLPAGMDKNNNAAMAQVYNTLDRYATMTGAAFALVHHASKGSQSDKDVVDVGSGAGSQSRAADTHLVLRPHEEPDSVVLDAAVRSWAPVSPIGLRWQFPLWTFDGNLDPSKLKGLKTDGESRKAAKELDDGAVVMEALETAGPLTLNKLTTHTGIGRDRLAKIVGLLLKGKRIISIEETVRGNVCDVYAVNPNPPKPITFSGYSQAIGLSDEF